MKTRIHAIAGVVGLLTILAFWSSTVVSELFGSYATIAAVKGMILKGMFILIPAMIIVGASGTSLSAGRTDALVLSKKKRMPFIAANGLLILVPMAFVLEARAAAGEFDTTFYLFQGLELLAGAVNLSLMGLNMRDGIRVSGRGKSASKIKLLSREMIADNTMAFNISKPEGFEHKAGQWIRLSLVDPVVTDDKGGSRELSIVSAPQEPHITLATRVSDSAFKQYLKGLPEGTELAIAGPNGSFTLDEDPARQAVFIVGGIGITPFMSIIRHITYAGLPHNIIVFYSNRNPNAAAFLSELEDLERANPNFRLVKIMTDFQAENNQWDGETDLINHEMLARYISNLKEPIYYCVGPTSMVLSTKEILDSIGVPRQNLVFEKFNGY
ncbi:FAD-dependent oxidoreductase [Kiloniella spongiae]|nr:FAD-dependent oxidoreductase [Kiloniella spongiae]